MADEKTAVDAAAPIDVQHSKPGTAEGPGPPAQSDDPQSRRPVIKGAARKKHPAKAKKYTEQEQTEKLRQIDAQVSDGKTTLKQAIKDAGLTEQTFYRWRRNGVHAVNSANVAPPAGGETDSFEALIELEAENERLRKLLADKLRAENAEMRKRLGLD
jgi:putative transposase